MFKVFRRNRKENLPNSREENLHYWQIDKDKDGIPDYLQKNMQLSSLVKGVADSNLQEIDAQKEKEQLEMKWRGMRYNPLKNIYEKWTDRMIDEYGIMSLSALIDTEVNKHSMNTSLKEEYVHLETIDAMKKVNAWLSDNQKRCKIALSNLDIISKEIEGLIFFSLSKSIDDKQRNHVTQRVKITESRQGTIQPTSI